MKGGIHYLKSISLATALFGNLGRRQLEAALIDSLQQGDEGLCSHRCGCRNQGMRASIDSSTNSNCIVSWGTCWIGEMQDSKDIQPRGKVKMLAGLCFEVPSALTKSGGIKSIFKPPCSPAGAAYVGSAQRAYMLRFEHDIVSLCTKDTISLLLRLRISC